MSHRHSFVRVQHEPVRRSVRVAAASNITPSMRRIIFESDSLRSFTSLGFDDHVKIFFPANGANGESTVAGRDFTPRRFDLENGFLTTDFTLHESGPATVWARQAKIGDRLEMDGPRGSWIIPDDFDWYLMLGDETALPAIGRRLEELRPNVSVATIVVVANEREQQCPPTKAAWVPIWIARNTANDSDGVLLRNALEVMPFPSGDGFIWLAGETTGISSLRSYLVDNRGHPTEWVRASGYWQRGMPGVHGRIEAASPPQERG